MNKVFLLGRLGKDPELKNLPGEKTVCNFSLATTRKTENKEFTTWHQVQCWGKLAITANNYLEKGSQAFIEGSINTREYEDKDGNKRTVTEIIAYSIQFLGKKEGGKETGGGNNAPF